jgi:hypothetical protein
LSVVSAIGEALVKRMVVPQSVAASVYVAPLWVVTAPTTGPKVCMPDQLLLPSRKGNACPVVPVGVQVSGFVPPPPDVSKFPVLPAVAGKFKL